MVDRIMTPSGRQDTQWGNPPGRPPGPTQHLIPVGPPPTMAGQVVDPATVMQPFVRTPTPTGRVAALDAATLAAPTADPTTGSSLSALVALPRLNSPFVNPVDGSPAIPWTQFITNLWRLVQPTGIVAGTYAGITFNIFGQAITAQGSGATIDSPVLTGTPTSPTPPVTDNSNRIATTSFVVTFVGAQGFITGVMLEGDVLGVGTNVIQTTVTALQHRIVRDIAPTVDQVLKWDGTAWVPGSAGIPDAPSDGNIYGRQNGQWVRLSQSVLPP